MRRGGVLLPLVLLAGCGWGMAGQAREGVVQASGTGGARSFAVGSFEQVALRGPDDAVVRVGPAFSVRAEGDPRVLDGLEVSVVDGELRLGRREGRWWSGDTPRGHARFIVTLPVLTAASLAGSGDLAVDGAAAPRFEASVAGSGDLSVAALRAREVDLNIAGSGGLRVGGQAETTSVSIAGSGSVDAKAFATRDADISIAGSGDVGLRASGKVDVSLVGSGDVTVTGTTACTVSRLGSGNAECRV